MDDTAARRRRAALRRKSLEGFCREMFTALTRFAGLRCPSCGGSLIFRAPFKVRHQCPSCGTLFEREEGYFVGALSINVVTTEFVILAVYLLCLLTVGFAEELIVTILLPAAVVFPVLFYHHSWSLWLSFDHFIEPLPGSERAKRRRPGP